MENNGSIIENYYKKFQHLAPQYASKVFSYQRIGYDRDDVVQEFRIKIYTSIIAYAARWKKYKEQGRYKPIDIETYIKSALANKVRDFIKAIKETPSKLSIEDTQFDYGRLTDGESNLSVKGVICELNGVSLIQGLDPKQSICFILYLKGYEISFIKRLYKGVNVERIIAKQKKNLEKYKKQLVEKNEVEFVSHHFSD